MHRRHFLALCAGVMLAPPLVLAAENTAVTDGKVILLPPVQFLDEIPAVMEFFSFYCPPCYAFSQQYGIDRGIRAVLPDGKKLVKYHTDFLGPLGADLTQAWSVAQVLGIDDRMEPLLFDAAQVSRTLNTREDIRAVFVNEGVDGAEYDRRLESKAVRELTERQRRLFMALGVTGTPSVYVNGRYLINNRGFKASSVIQFRADYVSVVAELLKDAGERFPG